MIEIRTVTKLAAPGTLFCLLSVGMTALLTGCGATNPLIGLPVPGPAGPVNSYVGKPGNSDLDTQLWSVTIDHTQNVYSYGPVSTTAVPTTGGFATLTEGFLVLLDQNGYQNGLAFEVPGEAVVLRPGDSSKALIFAVRQASCFAIGGNVKFLFALSPGFSTTYQAAFGRIYASTNGDGSSWQFNNQTQYQTLEAPGTNPPPTVPPAATLPGYPSGFPGTCSVSNASADVTASPLGYFFQPNSPNPARAYTIPTEYVISPSGFFFENQDYKNVLGSESWAYSTISSWGVAESSTPLNIGNVATADYLGFLFETAHASSAYRTRAVGFGNAPISGTTMTGGTLPSEDPTQQPTLNMGVTFGKQDPLNNGLYYSAKLTVPYDSVDTCGTPVVDQNGNLTCTYPAIAIVGIPSPAYKYTMLLIAFNSGDQKTLMLFQQ